MFIQSKNYLKVNTYLDLDLKSYDEEMYDQVMMASKAHAQN